MTTHSTSLSGFNGENGSDTCISLRVHICRNVRSSRSDKNLFTRTHTRTHTKATNGNIYKFIITCLSIAVRNSAPGQQPISVYGNSLTTQQKPSRIASGVFCPGTPTNRPHIVIDLRGPSQPLPDFGVLFSEGNRVYAITSRRDCISGEGGANCGDQDWTERQDVTMGG